MKYRWLAGFSLSCAIAFSGTIGAIAQTSTPSNTQATPTPAENQTVAAPLTVGIGGSPPFVIQGEDKIQGIIPDLWDYIATNQDIEYEFVLQTNTQAAIDAVANQELDLLIGPFSINAERLERVDFTQPYFVSRIGVLIPSESPSLWNRLKPLFRTTALTSAGVLALVLFLVGNGIWFAERKQNSEQFPEQYWQGVGNGMWFALVTLTTVGYGDRAPSTSAGRFVAGIWMLISMLAVSSLTAGLASALTLALSGATADSINNPDDLRDTKIAVISGTTGVTWAQEYQAKPQEYPNLQEAVTAITEDQVRGLIFDRPALQYYLLQNPDLKLELADFSLDAENFGFVLPRNSALTRDLSQVLLQLKQNNTIAEISDRWLKEAEKDYQSDSSSGK
ncbi:MAG: transporter substrate-binding domain-containing protein [Jaaginema sp. PMC 1079.18]|nr:transporter substrate-binding domain-containing protein [Jaaginema sp. PMC 1080.18]MEC4851443.1 transporter substrate-binding domain-containing protein [Jaaginema sp. PMC 1079.18]MEC4868254.1 transporter substrate-binding domain-containing protein [Jaaginema sp. PMC 1078.18]